jgi:hypothetical protein
MRNLPAAAALFGALAACATPPDAPPGLARARGRILADPLPADARIEVLRRDDLGLASPLVGFDVVPDRLGHFRTQPLAPGRYVLVLRSRDVPPAFANVRLPASDDVVLRPELPSGGVSIVLFTPAAREGPLRCRLVAPTPHGGVLDVRELVLIPGQDVAISGIAPGTWRIDATNSAATAELVVRPGATPQRFVIDPPLPAPGTGGVEGTVTRRDGSAPRAVLVSAWPRADDGRSLVPWGRYGQVGREGKFEVLGLPAGAAMIRVEQRAAAHRLVPPPEMIEIPPSGRVERAFVVDP